MFDLSLRTQFGLTLNVQPSSLIVMPAMSGKGPTDSRFFKPATAVQLYAPQEMVNLSRTREGSNTRMGMLETAGASIGVAMALLDNHLAVSVFDLGDPPTQAMATRAIEQREIRLLLRGDDDVVLIVPALTDVCFKILARAARVHPATFSAFTDAVGSVGQALATSASISEMGLDPSALKSVTLSVCVPVGEEQEEAGILH